MDPRDNPYTPNAGATPPMLVGREQQLEAFDVLLHRLEQGRTEQSMIITGLRGVGKTVLLGEFRRIATERDWAVIDVEVSKHDDSQFRQVIAREARRALYEISPRARWKARAERAAQVLTSFNVTVEPDGRLTASLEVEPLEGQADSGDLAADLADLLVALGEAAQDHETGVILLLDEIQFLDKNQLEAVISAIHRRVQRTLPITLTGAGLPQLAELAGEAKSYAERLFRFPRIDNLNRPDADIALTEPARPASVTFDNDALDTIYEFTEGYPYFLQEFGRAVWNIADGPAITEADARSALSDVEATLDQSFFRVRHDRTTELELAYLRAMAELGPKPQLAKSVAGLLDRTSAQCGPIRSGLIAKGLLYTPEHGYAAFTVPQFDKYLRREIPELTVPKVKKRKKKR